RLIPCASARAKFASNWCRLPRRLRNALELAIPCWGALGIACPNPSTTFLASAICVNLRPSRSRAGLSYGNRNAARHIGAHKGEGRERLREKLECHRLERSNQPDDLRRVCIYESARVSQRKSHKAHAGG